MIQSTSGSARGVNDGNAGDAGRATWQPKWASVVGAEVRQSDGEEAYTIYRVEVLSRDDRRWAVRSPPCALFLGIFLQSTVFFIFVKQLYRIIVLITNIADIMNIGFIPPM
jgi:hypothetical protein